jgi:predicted transcriptional regulator
MTKGFSGKINVSKSLMTSKGNWKKSNEQKMLANRHIKSDFPIEKPFETIGQVNKYLSGDTVICLLCGKDYKALAAHVVRIHNYTLDAYREKYKIPLTMGLVGKTTYKKLSALGKRNYQEGRTHNITQTAKALRSSGKRLIAKSNTSLRQIQRDIASKDILAKATQARHEKRLTKTHCKKGHLLQSVGVRACYTCTRIWVKSQPGYTTREEAANTYVPAVCVKCGGECLRKKLGAPNKTAMCTDCRLAKEKGSSSNKD